MQHMVNSMIEDAVDCRNVWFVDSCASNCMTSHSEWFSDVKNLEKLLEVTNKIQMINGVKKTTTQVIEKEITL